MATMPIMKMATTKGLIGLFRHGSVRGQKMFALSLAVSGAAAMADIASLFLLQRWVGAFVQGGGEAASDARPLLTFLGAGLLGSALRLIAVRQMVSAQYILTRDLSVKAFRNLQHQDYGDFRRDGASEGFAAFDRLQILSLQALTPVMAATAAILSALALMLAMIIMQPLVAPLLILPICLAVIRKRPASSPRADQTQAMLTRQKARLIYDGRRAFRDIFLTNAQDRISADFAGIESSLRHMQGRAVISAQSSRHTLEIAGLGAAFVMIAAMAMLGAERHVAVPMLSVLGLGAFRLLPQMATIRASVRMVAVQSDVTEEVNRVLSMGSRETMPGPGIRLTRAISLKDVLVSRADRPDTLVGLSLEVRRGQRIGIFGASGAGKSTLLDLICGAVQADCGTLTVDGLTIDRNLAPTWRSRIGVVSQNPVLFGETLREAITFPQLPEEIDAARLDWAVEATGVASFAQFLVRGLDTPIGEAIEHLSGGQRQRVALAHALYRARDLLILDEATGQLDRDSERAVIDVLAGLPRDLTIVIASHREAVFKLCDSVYHLIDGRLSISQRPAGPTLHSRAVGAV